MKHNYIEENKNVRIRPLEERDIENLRTWRNNVKDTKFLSPISYISKEMQNKWFNNTLINPNEIVFAIDEVKELNRMVGSVSLYNIEQDKAEFGRILIGDEQAHGKKVGFNSIKALLKIAFEQLELKEIYLHVDEENIAARKVYEEVGFKVSEQFGDAPEKELLMKISFKMYLEDK